MPIPIGRGPRASAESPEALLLECHERIRSFCGLARKLAAVDLADASPAEIAAAADAVASYFSRSLPLHVRDEEQSVAPRLVGRSPRLDAALETMRSEHSAHERSLAALVQLLRTIEAGPAILGRERVGLATLALEVEVLLSAHLLAEETLVIPALSTLSAEERKAIVDEIRARRRIAP
jgi:iron-sulfur cluster repair protein YtfE (RIC family)